MIDSEHMNKIGEMSSKSKWKAKTKMKVTVVLLKNRIRSLISVFPLIYHAGKPAANRMSRVTFD